MINVPQLLAKATANNGLTTKVSYLHLVKLLLTHTLSTEILEDVAERGCAQLISYTCKCHRCVGCILAASNRVLKEFYVGELTTSHNKFNSMLIHLPSSSGKSTAKVFATRPVEKGIWLGV